MCSKVSKGVSRSNRNRGHCRRINRKGGGMRKEEERREAVVPIYSPRTFVTVRDRARALASRAAFGRERAEGRKEREKTDVRWQQPCFTWSIASPPLSFSLRHCNAPRRDTRPNLYTGRYNFLTGGSRVPRRDVCSEPIAS